MVTAVSSPAFAGNTNTVSTKTNLLRVPAPRLVSVDVLRGLVMVLMALDHTRDFLSYPGFPPEDLAHTNGALFLTRVITHFCAPVFAFLAGTGAFLATSRGKSIQQVSRFFLTRGLWLVLLELTIIDFAWGFVPWVHGGVIWGLGWSMVVMALIVRLPLRWIGALGLGTIATHNLLDRINPALFGKLSWLWILLHTPGRIPITSDFQFSARYVLIPWIGVMAAGFAFGSLLLRPDRRKLILTIGISATALFFVLRLFNAYGNGIAGLPFGYPRSAGPWSVQPTLTLTLISFFNTLKYPPSLDYLLMTLGPSLTLLGLFDKVKGERGLSRILLVFGRVPLLYYVLHLYLLHVLAILISLAFHQPTLHGSVIADFARKPDGYGHGLPFIYAMWILAVTILYMPCLWFMKFRSRHRDWNWLSYL
jgi:uncharacterized membrane protein